MDKFQEVDAKQLTESPFKMIGGDWMLITAVKDGVVNTMTASWGGMGVLWNRNVVYSFIRQSRFTKEFIDASDSFSITFFNPEEHRKTLGYLGSVSGREENKIEKSEFQVQYMEGIPYFKEARTVLLCKKLSKHFLAPEDMFDPSILPQYYADGDYHDMYVGEILKVLVEK